MNSILNFLISLFQIIGMRKLVIMIFLLLMVIQYLHQRRHKKTQVIQEDLSNYPTDSQGRYPWEYDIDDSPNSIPKNSKKYINETAPKRGRWS